MRRVIAIATLAATSVGLAGCIPGLDPIDPGGGVPPGSPPPRCQPIPDKAGSVRC